MKLNYYKKLMYDYKYSNSIGIPQQIYHIKRVQRKHKKKTKMEQINSALRKVVFKKQNTIDNDYREFEFLGI